MKKILMLIVISFFLTGCKVTYSIDIDDNFNENIIISPSNDDESKEMSEYDYNETSYYDPDDFDEEGNKIPGIEYYNQGFNGNTLNFDYKFGDNYHRSAAINACYPSIIYDENKYSVVIESGNDSACFDNYDNLEEITINIKTSKKVIETNAHTNNGNTYTWIINKKTKDKSIYFEYEISEKSEEENLDIINNVDSDDIDPSENKNSDSNSNDDNNGNKNMSINDDVKTKGIQLLYILLPLFFVLLFVIIKNRDKINKR